MHGELLTPQTGDMLARRPGALRLLLASDKASLFSPLRNEFKLIYKSAALTQPLSPQYIVDTLTPTLDLLGPTAWQVYLQLLPNWQEEHDALLETTKTLVTN